MKDDNDEIMFVLKERLQIGRDRYGHGIRVMDDTREWGTPADSWAEMGLEEALDLFLYLSAAIVRLRHADEIQHSSPPSKSDKKVGLIGRAIAWIKSHF